MGETSIEWTDFSVNFWWGCTQISKACDHCYAKAWDKRLGGDHFGVRADRREIKGAASALQKINRNADKFRAEHGRWPRTFMHSMSDVFDNAVPADWRHRALSEAAQASKVTIQLVTKRIGNVESMAGEVWKQWPQHIGLIISVCDQAEADRDIPKLLALKAKLGIPWVGLSIEPMLGPIDLTSITGWKSDSHLSTNALTGWSLHDDSFGPVTGPKIDWVIVGGESGPNARPMHIDWARSIRDQCAASDTPFIFKQWGEYAPVEVSEDSEGDLGPAYPIAGCSDPAAHKYNQPCLFWQDDHDDSAPVQWPQLDGGFGSNHWIGARRIGTKAAGRLLDGVEHNGFPAVQL